MAVAAMELRGDGLHIRGYVNVPGRRSRPVMTPRGRVVEVIEQGAFARAIAKAQDIKLMIDHERTVASTKAGSLKLQETEMELRAEGCRFELKDCGSNEEYKARLKSLEYKEG